MVESWLLPPAYVDQREGTVFTGVCPHLGGNPSPSHNTSTGTMSFLRGVPQWLSKVLSQGVPQWLVPGPFPEGTPAKSRLGYPGQVQTGGTPARSRQGVPWPEMGYPHPEMVYPSSGPGQGPPLQRWCYPTPPIQRWSTLPPPEIGQRMEYLICGGRYASCVSRRRTFLSKLIWWYTPPFVGFVATNNNDSDQS